MAIECVEAQEWIEEEIHKPVEQWVEKTEQQCKKRKWYDPRRWVCYLVTTFVKAIVWVAVKVGKWVVRTVCSVVSTLLGFLRDFFTGLWNMLVGIFTLDWRRFLDGLLGALASLVDSFLKLLRVLLLIDTLDFIITEVQQHQLRTYVRTRLGFKYSGQEFHDIVDFLHIDYGAFGYRIQMRAIRTFLDSEEDSPEEPGVPNLVVLHETDGINLRELCGFDVPSYWNQKRYKTLKKGPHATGGGAGEVDNPISEDELELYLSSRGAAGPKFFVLCMRDGVLRAKLRAAEVKGRQVGLMPSWNEETHAVVRADHITHNGYDTGRASSSLVNFLAEPILRKRKVRNPFPPNGDGLVIDETEALGELCTPVAVGIFGYTDGLRGLAAPLKGSPCGQDPHDASGVTFIDNKPDIVWKYVPIHELGHCFGLCHVRGFDRIMYSPREHKGWWEKVKGALELRTLYSLVILKGEPSFTLDEGMAVWDYIIEHFPARCLGSKATGPVIL